jgi:hypothetical protein
MDASKSVRTRTPFNRSFTDDLYFYKKTMITPQLKDKILTYIINNANPEMKHEMYNHEHEPNFNISPA